ncbi:YkoF family thiamine/hydroxymethylpyrimidine-binding protein [Aliidiomarina indica]|uniref:YkoF family thiamine/hydroxymethylpyrimidine-binding protein n=1 Tax=Aliidiomarina indica TaxID=2749147 RepID=UPI00188DE7B0|nr:YkoF family thiamine/hydroxymethylpyrimidine-binding protein [Aliidiomarina indica]
MQFSAEISLYPLADEFRPVIKEFVERLATYSEITVNTNTMSTQIFGDYRTVMTIVTDELERVYQKVPSQVLVCKFINRDLNPNG